MTIRQLNCAMNSFDYCSYIIRDRYNRVLCKPSVWICVPLELRDLEIGNAWLKDHSTSEEKAIEIIIQIKDNYANAIQAV